MAEVSNSVKVRKGMIKLQRSSIILLSVRYCELCFNFLMYTVVF